MLQGEYWFRGNKWPPADLSVPPPPPAFPTLQLPAPDYRYYAWSDYHYSIVALSQFIHYNTSTPQATLWYNIQLGNYPNPAAVAGELSELQTLMDYRQGVMAEALAQRNNIVVFYAGLLTFGRSSHPATWRLAQIVSRVGQFQAMYYKSQFNRPRASQVSPNLMPPIEVPGHASYPSGHATESRLLSNVLSQVMPAAVSQGLPGNLPGAYGAGRTASAYPYSWPQAALMRLAERIARNREVLGLHYPSDSKAGVYLADQTFVLLWPFLLTVTDTTTGTLLVDEARSEWQ
ncbi:MAG: hypothetical protein ACHQAY_21775 [Hyphomicrobiales bacterium]